MKRYVILSGDKTTEGLIRTCPDLPKLKVVTSGPIPPNPAELIGSEQMSNLLKFLQRQFTHVVVDSPPIASFNAPRTRSLRRLASNCASVIPRLLRSCL